MLQLYSYYPNNHYHHITSIHIIHCKIIQDKLNSRPYYAPIPSHSISDRRQSNHKLHILANLLATISPVSIICNGFPNSRGQCSFGSRQLEGKHELVDLLEILAQSSHLMDDILQTDHLASQVLLHLGVGLYLNALVSHLAVELLVDQLTRQFLRGLTPGYVILDST